jgi:uncharacterized RDD family membrane protein YckC
VPDRLAALLADALALSAMAFAVAVVVSIVLGPAVDLDTTAESAGDAISVDRSVAVVDAFVVAALGLAYFAGSWWRAGRTPGQRCLRLRVAAAQHGGRPSAGQAVMRWALLVAPFSLAAIAGAAERSEAAVALLAVAAWYAALLVSAALDGTGRGLHDRITGTAVGKAAAAWPALEQDAGRVR